MRVHIHKFLQTADLEIIDTKRLKDRAFKIIYNQLKISQNKKATHGTE